MEGIKKPGRWPQVILPAIRGPVSITQISCAQDKSVLAMFGRTTSGASLRGSFLGVGRILLLLLRAGLRAFLF
jgi:hypothetical protein